MTEKKCRLSLETSFELRDEIKIAAIRRNKTMKEFITEAIEKVIKEINDEK